MKQIIGRRHIVSVEVTAAVFVCEIYSHAKNWNSKSTHPLRIGAQMTGVLLLSLFPKFTGQCVNTPSAWLRTNGVVFVGGGGLCKFCTRLLTVFLNNEVTVFAGLTPYSLLWEIREPGRL